MKKRKFYVVWEGFAPGIYDSWDECLRQVEGYPGAKYRSYSSQTEATMAFRGDTDREMYALRTIASGMPVEAVAEPAPKSGKDNVMFGGQYLAKPTAGLAVDAACAGNPGVMEYRGVDLATGKEVFHFGPVKDGTNNVGEFLALVHALALCKQKGWGTVVIYTDSRTAISWVRNGKAKTTLRQGQDNSDWYGMISRAENWLAANLKRNTVKKWQTEVWGEVPADFGRK